MNTEKNDLILLKEILGESEELINLFLAKSPAFTVDKIVPTALFRRMLGLSQKIVLCIENGLNENVILDYRALVETFLNFQYIFQKAQTQPSSIQDRAFYYYIKYNNIQIHKLKYLKDKGHSNEDIEKSLQNYQHNLNETSIRHLVEKFDNFKYINKKTKEEILPQFFSIESKITSYNQLSREIEQSLTGSKGTVLSDLYKFSSVDVHGECCIDSVNKYNDSFTLKSLKTSIDQSISKSSETLTSTRGLILDTLGVFKTYVLN